MIEIKFKGGLGNQMFQYALYVQLKKRYTGTQFRFDTDSYLYEKFHTGFDLTRVFADSDVRFDRKSTSLLMSKYYKLKVNTKKYVYPYLPWIVYLRDDLIKMEQLNSLNLSKHNFLTGTWYSDKYFADACSEVKQAFQFDNSLTDKNESLLLEIDNCNSVGMHVRRADFITMNVEKTPLSETDFYERATNLLSQIKNKKIFVFSDEPYWCIKNMRFLQNYEHVFITNNQGSQSFRDMQLMSRCKHNIIANSSFSWWAAFLNPNPNKIVICPAILDNGKHREDIHHWIYCDKWVKI